MTPPVKADGTHRADGRLAAKLRRRLVRLRSRRGAARDPGARLLSLSFDDAPRSAFTLGGEILREKAARATYFVCAGLEGRTGPMGDYGGRADAQAAHAADHEIACHTFSHMDLGSASAADTDADLARNREALAAWGLPAPETFAYPFGDVGYASKAAAGRRFRLSRGLHHGLMERGADLNQAPAVGVEGDGGEALAHAWMQRLAERPAGWLILFSHGVEPSPTRFSMSAAALAGILDAAHERGFEIVTVAEGARRMDA